MDAHWSERSQGASSTRWLAHPLYMPFQKLWAHLLYYFLLIILRWLFLSVAFFLVSVSSIGQNSHQRKKKHLREEILQNCEADPCRRLFKSSESTTSNPTPCSPLRGQTSSRDSQRWGQPHRASVRQSRRRNLWRFYFFWSNKNVKRPSVFNFLGGFGATWIFSVANIGNWRNFRKKTW